MPPAISSGVRAMISAAMEMDVVTESPSVSLPLGSGEAGERKEYNDQGDPPVVSAPYLGASGDMGRREVSSEAAPEGA